MQDTEYRADTQGVGGSFGGSFCRIWVNFDEPYKTKNRL
ncbi:hypothetical protein SAMN05660206_103185 [Sphingobacterium wenxiniae]|uniref:Uncharacterized protein n=1 Tax=Sphingobacterium wenxiniae TaxID=683125 RepID=A0A1I6R818_9SPHI|nr:hypothetical protein SAMN05660206_103185 [Sphingobacterium wenxiniae]